MFDFDEDRKSILASCQRNEKSHKSPEKRAPILIRGVTIGAISKTQGCETTVTFDKRAAKLAEFSEG